jgi:hypothetical protein
MVWTRFPGGVVGPDRAFARPTTRPGISARQNARSSATSNVIGTNSTPRSSPILPAKMAGHPPGLAPEDHLQSLALPFIGPLVDKKAHPKLALIGPDIAFEGPERQQIETVQSDIAVTTLANMATRASLRTHCWSEPGQIHKGMECCNCRCRTNHRRDATREPCSCHSPSRGCDSRAPASVSIVLVEEQATRNQVPARLGRQPGTERVGICAHVLIRPRLSRCQRDRAPSVGA